MIDAGSLPERWELKPLRECVAPKQLWNPKREPRQRIRYIELSGIDSEAGLIASFSDILATKAPSRARKIVKAGDVIFGTTRPSSRNVAVIPAELDNEICSTGFCVLRPRPGIMSTGWLFALCRGDVVASQVLKHDEKNAYPSVSDDQILDAMVPLPPWDEQLRLVGRLEKFTSRVLVSRQSRQQALSAADRVFQRALELAFAESVTEAWEELPADSLFEITSGQLDPREPAFRELPYLGPEHVESGTSRIIGARISVGSLNMKSGKYHFGPEHVVYSKIRPALRKVCTPDYEGLCSADMYALRPRLAVVTRQFLKFLLLAPGFSDYAIEKSDRNAMPKINQAAIRGYRFRVPDRLEQERIAGLLNALLDKQGELRRLQLDTASALEALVPALLSRAATGNL